MPDSVEAIDDRFKLWTHQEEAIGRLRQGFRQGPGAQVLMIPTGGGKTRVAAFLLDECAKKGNRAAFVVDRVNLVDQTSAVLDSFRIPHGVLQADHWRKRAYERVQVCSAQTIEKRGFFPELKLLIVDECHDSRQATLALIKNRPDLYTVGLSATPFSKGMGATYGNLVNVCTTNDLIDQGVLVPLRTYAARSLDMDGAKVIAGEWSDKDIEQRGMAIVGDIVSEWVAKTQQHFGGPVKTIVFSATVEHGSELCRQFNAAGFNFQQISYRDTSDDHRRELIEEFRKPNSEIHGLISCEVFTKGFDVPDILCGIGARPYRKSLSSHIQQLGRVMRSSPGKEFGLWLDHCGNVLRFARDTTDIFANGLDALDDGAACDAVARKELSDTERKAITCSCGFVLPPAAVTCPGCGKERHRRSLVENVAGVLEEVGARRAVGKRASILDNKSSIWRQLCGHALERKKGDPVLAKKFALAQYRNFYNEWPSAEFSTTNIETASAELLGKVQHNLIKKFTASRGRNAVR